MSDIQKILLCKEIIDVDCDHVEKGVVTDDMIHAMFEHIKQAHPEKIKDLDEEMKKMLLDKMHRLIDAL